MDTWLLDAAHIKAVRGRKTDVKDAEWIAQLLEHGLLAPSFVPPPEIRRLRMLTRSRVQLMGDCTRDTIRAGTDARGRLDQALLGRLEPDHGLRAAMRLSAVSAGFAVRRERQGLCNLLEHHLSVHCQLYLCCCELYLYCHDQ
jgi:hypothetical protein